MHLDIVYAHTRVIASLTPTSKQERDIERIERVSKRREREREREKRPIELKRMVVLMFPVSRTVAVFIALLHNFLFSLKP
jgi:hypothetical protein